MMRGAGAKERDISNTAIVGTSLIWGFGEEFEAKIAACIAGNRPFFHMDHAYFKRGYEHGNFRVNFGNVHQTKIIKGLPDDRAKPWRKRLLPWGSRGATVVVIVPSDSLTRLLSRVHGGPANPKDWVRSVEKELRQYTDRPIYIKHKGEGLAGVLEFAWAVVSYSSVAEVEAVIRGIPVFTSPHSPANQVGLLDLSQIETPVFPDREDWFRTLSYSQFHKEEASSGKAWGILKELYGD